MKRCRALLVLLAFFAWSLPALAVTIPVLEVRNATWTNNPANIANHQFSQQQLTLTVGIGAAASTQTSQVVDMGYGAAGARINVPDLLEFSLRFKGEKRAIDENTIVGVVIDYHTPSGYLRRGFVDAGAGVMPGRIDAIPFWGRGSLPDFTFNATPTLHGQVRLDLREHAPLGWDRQIWLTALIENTGRGTELEVVLANTEEKLEKNATSSPPMQVEPIAWQNVNLINRTLVCSPLDEAQAIAYAKFQQHLPLTLTTTTLAGTGSSVLTTGPKLIISDLKSLESASPTEAAEFRNLLADPLAWRTEQGYVLKYDAKRDILFAVAGGRLGLIYAISHLQRTLLLEPAPAIALERECSVERPKLEERGIYVNIGYGLSMGPITVDNWNEQQWEDFIDRLVLSRVTFWTFFFWGDCEYIYPDSTGIYTEHNRKVFPMVRHAMEYGRRRGLRVSYLATPSMIPTEMLARHPDWRNTLEFDSPGTICTRHPEAYATSKLFHRHEMEYFKSADEFDITFYDPGGCMCTECRKGDVQLEQLLKQLADYGALSQQINPQARFGFWTWAVWRYERLHQYSLQNKLIPRAVELFKGRTDRVVVIDSLRGDLNAVPYFDEAKQHGFRTSNFIYQTNIEDGWGLLLPLLEFTHRYAGEAQQKKLDESFLMIMEVNSKYPMAHFGADFFWDADLTPAVAAGRYGLQLTGNVAAAHALQRAFLELDDMTYIGASGVDGFVDRMDRIQKLIAEAAAATPESRRGNLAMLTTTGQAYRMLYEAVALRHAGKQQEYAAMKTKLSEAMTRDPLFSEWGKTYVPRHFDQFVSWLDNGFRNGQF